MIIDTHQHVFWQNKNDADLIADMDEQGIGQAWLLTWEIPPAEDSPQYHRALNPLGMRPDGTHAGITLRDTLIARDRYPDRFVLGYCPHPGIDGAPDLFEAAYHIHGARVCGEWKCRMLFDDPRCLELFSRAGRLHCPVVLHLDVPYLPDADGKPQYCPNWYGGTVANLERALSACPETHFLGHGPGFWREISADADAAPSAYPKGPVVAGGRLPALLDSHANLYLDLSAGSGQFALERDPEHAKGFLARYADRVLFARDFYGGDLHQFLQTLDLPQDLSDKLYSENARELLASPPT